jgi:Fe-S-cluster containining protein
MASPCASCHTHCCFDYTVTITGYDAWRIATALRVAVDAFAVALEAKEPVADAFRLDGGERRLVLALRRRGPDDEHARACTFWLPLGPAGRCGIHPQRPDVCRVYPAYLRDGNVQLRPDAKCPAAAWNLADMDLPWWREQLEHHRRHAEAYRSLVERWNERMEAVPEGRPVPLEAYYRYLMDFYDRADSEAAIVPSAR